MHKIYFITLGAVPGALFRWQINNDFFVNIFGAALLGFVFGAKLKPRYQLVFGLGFCGASTTFSGWIVDSLDLLMSGFYLNSLQLIIATFSFGLVASILGFYLGRLINR